MGEMADSLIDGEFDCITGEYIGEGVGYSRTMEKDRTYNHIYGVINFIKKNRQIINRHNEHHQIKLICEFCNVPINNKMSYKEKEALCVKIQADFGKFVKYLKKKS